MRVQPSGRQATVTVMAAGDNQTVSHPGAALLAESADRVGLTGAPVGPAGRARGVARAAVNKRWLPAGLVAHAPALQHHASGISGWSIDGWHAGERSQRRLTLSHS